MPTTELLSLLPRLSLAIRLGALREFLCKQPELVTPPGAAPPDKSDPSRRHIAQHWSRNQICSTQEPGIDCERWEQRHSESVVDHLDQRREARRLKTLPRVAVSQMARLKSMFAQAMTVLQQQQVLLP